MKHFLFLSALALGLAFTPVMASSALAHDHMHDKAKEHMSDKAKEAYGGQKGDAKKATDKAKKEAEKAEKDAKKAKDKMKKEY